jgi:hypothetical protein
VQHLGKKDTLPKNCIMKSILLMAFCLSLTGIAYTLQSCCKVMCVDGDISTIDFRGFNASEIDKIKVLRFNHNNFSVALDSFYVSSNNIIIRDTTRAYLDNPLVSDFDFKINVEKAGRTYTISDFQTKKENCTCNPGTHKMITGYKLDGVQYSMEKKYAVEINK